MSESPKSFGSLVKNNHSCQKVSDRLQLKNGPFDKEFFRYLEAYLLDAIAVIKNFDGASFDKLELTKSFNDRLRRS